MFTKGDWVKLHPAWYGLVSALAVPISTWFWWSIFGPLALDGTGLMVFWIYSLFGWPIAYGLFAEALRKLLELSGNVIARGVIVAAITVVYLLMHGLPSPWIAIIALSFGVWLYVIAARALDDQRALEKL